MALVNFSLFNPKSLKFYRVNLSCGLLFDFSFASTQALLLENSSLLVGSSAQNNGICEVLYAAAWIVGEFSEFLLEPRVTLEAMLRQRVTSLPGHIQVSSKYIIGLLKDLGTVCNTKHNVHRKTNINPRRKDFVLNW